MSDISVKSINLENKQFILQVSNVPDVVKQYPVKVTAILENGEQITQTKMVTLKVTPTVSISGSDSFVAKNGSGTSNYVFVYEPEVYNVDVVVNSVVSSNSSVSVTSVSKNGFSLSVVDISADLSTAITASISIDGKETIVIKNITVTYKESRQPFILYNAGEDADVGIYRSSSNVKMTQMYYAVVDDFIAGEDYDDSNIEYQIYENNTTRTVTISTVKTGQALLLKAVEKNRLSSNSNDYCNFTMIKGRFNAYGEVGALDGFYTALDFCCYQNMFTGCASLTTAPELPATTLEMYCYSSMFSGCTSLTTAPELPATTLATGCYKDMFDNCIGLTTAPELPATTLATGCYFGMLSRCNGIKTPPRLPVTELKTQCYAYMFYLNTGITTAPELPATALVSQCYSEMFHGCTGLTAAPELPATTLVDNCYNSMFNGCSNLQYIKALFTTTPSTSYTKNWCNGVAASGVFIKNNIAEWDLIGVNGIPSGWEIRLNATHVSWDSLSITADDVNGRKTSTIIHYTLIETMLDENGANFQRTVTGNAESDTFEQNTSTTDSKTISISYTEPKSGLTATTTITQGVWVDQSYTVDLNSQWQESSTNPDSTLYDCYESFSNYHVSNANAIMYITIEGFTEFSLYIRSYAESSYDYVVVGNLDATSISRTTSNVKAHTSGNQNSNTSLSAYTKVTFSGLDGLEHKIPILYGKDGSTDSGTDRGYVIIEKNQ